MPPDPTPTPVPTLDLVSWAASVDAQLVTGVELVQLLVFTLVLVGGVLVAASVATLVAQLRVR